MIIALCGPDGAGKGTAATLLRDYLSIDLNLKDVHLVQMPGATGLGQELRRVVKSTKFSPCPMAERLIFVADTVQFESECADQALGNDCYVICDRFARITDLIYGSASGLDLGIIHKLQTAAGTRLDADYFFPFQLPAEVAWERKSARNSSDKDKCRIEEKGKEFFWKVAAQYNAILPYHRQPIKPGDYVYAVSASDTSLQDHVQARAKRIIPVDATQSPKEIVKFIISKLPLVAR